ncbi:MAG TPA: hypothetical protein DEB40_02050 [Elusimicrobia bacterium]|nr:hypothetical protein [Elusimicrobiota bacterium]HBT60513.1 hypothetical protein [Elusimicrobiota bacterium]
MSEFFERNKKKSLLGLLFLLFRKRKTLAALLLVAVMLSFVFIAPSNFAGGFFGSSRAAAALAWVAAKLGMGGVLGTSGEISFGSVLKAFRSAQQGKDIAWSDILGRGGAASANGSSVSLVSGNAQEFGLAGSGLTRAAGRAARSVNGILNPEDAEKGGEGVALEEGDLTGERARQLAGADRGLGYAGPGGWHNEFGASGSGNMGSARQFGGAAGPGGRAAGSAGSTAYAGRDFFSGGVAAGSGRGDNVTSAFSGTKVPGAGRAKIQAGNEGHLSRAVVAKASTERRQALNHNVMSASKGPFAQLADGRARAQMAREPICTAENGCPSEYAATNVGAVYDGNRVGPGAPDVLVAVPVDGSSLVNVPSDAQLQGYIDEARQAEINAQKCKDAQNTYGPREDDLSAQLQAKADELNAMDCGGGGCSKSKARRCKAKGNEMKAVCVQLYDVQCQHIMACPLTAGDGCPTVDCNR